MSVAKSDLIKELADSYPNFLRKDLTKLFDIIINEMKNSLKRNERVELRDIFTIEPRIQNARLGRNPATGDKVEIPMKKKVHFKASTILLKRLNEN